MAASFHSYFLCFPYCMDPPLLLQMLFSQISSFFGIYIPMLLFPQAFFFSASEESINLPPSPSFHHPNCHLQNSPTAVENFDSSGVPKVSSLSDVRSIYPFMRETICTGLVSDPVESQLCRRRKSPVLAELLPGFPLLFPVANKRGVNAPAEHCRRG